LQQRWKERKEMGSVKGRGGRVGRKKERRGRKGTKGEIVSSLLWDRCP